MKTTPNILLDPNDPNVERYFILKDIDLVRKETKLLRDHINKYPPTAWTKENQQAVIVAQKEINRSYAIIGMMYQTLKPHLN